MWCSSSRGDDKKKPVYLKEGGDTRGREKWDKLHPKKITTGGGGGGGGGGGVGGGGGEWKQTSP